MTNQECKKIYGMKFLWALLTLIRGLTRFQNQNSNQFKFVYMLKYNLSLLKYQVTVPTSDLNNWWFRGQFYWST